MKHDQTSYTETGFLAFEASGNEVVAIAESASGSVRESASACMSLREAIKARRALSRTIRIIRSQIDLGP